MSRMTPQDWQDKVATKVMAWYESLDDYPDYTFTVVEASKAIDVHKMWVRLSVLQLMRQDQLEGHFAQELLGHDGCAALGVSPFLAMYNAPEL